MTVAFVTPSSEVDALFLVNDMRDADVAELAAASNEAAYDTIVRGVRTSAEAWSCFVDGRLMMMWGVVRLSPAGAIVDGNRGWGWMLTTNIVDQHRKLFYRTTQQELAKLLDHWAVLENFIDVRHTRALRWGKRLGFQFEAPVPYGSSQLPAQRFVITKETLNVQSSPHTRGSVGYHRGRVSLQQVEERERRGDSQRRAGRTEASAHAADGCAQSFTHRGGGSAVAEHSSVDGRS